MFLQVIGFVVKCFNIQFLKKSVTPFFLFSFILINTVKVIIINNHKTNFDFFKIIVNYGIAKKIISAEIIFLQFKVSL